MTPQRKAQKHSNLEPSSWVVEHASLVPPKGVVLDLAAGRGRHSRLFLSRNHPIVAADRDPSGLRDLADNRSAETITADLEHGPWPFEDRRFDGIVVANYLWRPLFPNIEEALAPGGVLIYETFAVGNEKYGKPSNPDFLLREGELPEAFSALKLVAYEHGVVETPKPAVTQRFCAIKPG